MSPYNVHYLIFEENQVKMATMGQEWKFIKKSLRKQHFLKQVFLSPKMKIVTQQDDLNYWLERGSISMNYSSLVKVNF